MNSAPIWDDLGMPPLKSTPIWDGCKRGEGVREVQTGHMPDSRNPKGLLPILLLAHLLQPVHHFAVFLFLNRDVRHGHCRSSAVPVFLIG